MLENVPEISWRIGLVLLTAGVVAVPVAALAGRMVIPWLVRRKLQDGQPRKASDYLNLLNQGKQHTPTMGGLFLVPSVLAVALVGGVALTVIGLDAARVWAALGLAALAVLAHAALGMVDDFAKLTRRGDGLRGRVKLAAQCGIALVCCTGGVMLIGVENAVLRLPGLEIFLGWALVPIGAFIVVGASNAYNLTDGLDGLAGGTGAVAFHALALAAALPAAFGASDPALGWTTALLGVAASGCLVGFLFWNRHPAKVFMGDTGSLALGALLGMMAVLGRLEIVLALAGGVFVAEALSVMLQVGYFKATGGRRILRCAPLHHHFQFGGWHETKVTRRFLAAGMVCAALAIAAMPPLSRPAAKAPATLERATPPAAVRR